MKKKLKLILLGIVYCLLVGLAACGQVQGPYFTKFEVPGETDVSYGSEYDIPAVLVETRTNLKLLAEYTVEYQDGTSVSAPGNKLFVDKLGYYELTYTVSHTEGETLHEESKVCRLNVKNDIAPTIETASDFYFIYTGTQTKLPEVSCYDAVGNEIQPTYALVRVEEDGTETPIGIESGCFVPDQNGSYKLTITAQAEGGVPATKEILYEAAYDEGKVLYTDYGSGTSFLVQNNENAGFAYSDEIAFDREKGSVEIFSQNYLTDAAGDIWMDVSFANSAIEDVSGYKNIYFYLYNAGKSVITINLNNVFGEDVTLYPGLWNLVRIPQEKYPRLLPVRGEGGYTLNGFRLISNIRDKGEAKLYLSSVRVADALPSVDLSAVAPQTSTGEFDLSGIAAYSADGTKIEADTMRVFDSENLPLEMQNAKVTFEESGVYTVYAAATSDGVMASAAVSVEVVSDRYVLKMTQDLKQNYDAMFRLESGCAQDIRSDGADYQYGDDTAAYRVNLSADIAGDGYINFYIRPARKDFTGLGGIYFYVKNIWNDNVSLLYIKDKDGTPIEQSVILNGSWARIEIRSEDFSTYFSDPSDVEEIGLLIKATGGASGYLYYISSIFAQAEGAAEIDLSSLPESVLQGTSLSFENILVSGNKPFDVIVEKPDAERSETTVSYADRAEGYLFDLAGYYKVTVVVTEGDVRYENSVYVPVLARPVANDDHILQWTEDMKLDPASYYEAGAGTTLLLDNNADGLYGGDKYSLKATLSVYTGAEGYITFTVKPVNKNVAAYDGFCFYIRNYWNDETSRIYVKDKNNADVLLNTFTQSDGWVRVEISSSQYAALFADPSNVSALTFVIAVPGGDPGFLYYISSLYTTDRPVEMTAGMDGSVFRPASGVSCSVNTDASGLYGSDSASLKVNLTAYTGAAAFLNFSIALGKIDLTKYSYIEFHVKKMFIQDKSKLYIKDKNGDLQELAAFGSDDGWITIRIDSDMFASYFADPAAVTALELMVTEPGGNNEVPYYFSSVGAYKN